MFGIISAEKIHGGISEIIHGRVTFLTIDWNICSRKFKENQIQWISRGLFQLLLIYVISEINLRGIPKKCLEDLHNAFIKKLMKKL